MKHTVGKNIFLHHSNFGRASRVPAPTIVSRRQDGSASCLLVDLFGPTTDEGVA